ncbi:hypothetical protein C2E23DRAFT_887191 [Lenzites betulinus]|nr:hypothetical protein C2E23DRAFT_887191 [Lenzites betulinus]
MVDTGSRVFCPIHRPDTDPMTRSAPQRAGRTRTRELDITDTVNVVILLDKLRTGQRSSVEDPTKRAIIAQQLTNCLTEMFTSPSRALKEVDGHLTTQGKPVGPLHGLPISGVSAGLRPQ